MKRYWVVFALFVLSMITYIDHVCISSAKEPMAACQRSSKNVVFWTLGRCGATSSAPKARIIRPIIKPVGFAGDFTFCPGCWHNSKVPNADPDGNVTLRLKLCGDPDCRKVFTVCINCDRGQRYCGPACRAAVRCQQRKAANNRYQQSEHGRDAHRRCQRRYRESLAPAPVTDQARSPITMPAPSRPPTLCQCAVCGRQSRWIDPFPPIPRS